MPSCVMFNSVHRKPVLRWLTLHFARQVRVVELARVADALVRRQFEIGSAKGVALAGGEIGKRHLLSAADFGLQAMNLARKSVRWKPLGHCVGIEERSINSLWCPPEYSVESDGVCVVCCHDSLCVLFALGSSLGIDGTKNSPAKASSASGRRS